MKKRMVSLLLVLALVVGICPAAFAVKTNNVGVYRIDNTETQEMSAEEIKKYQKYTVVPETESVYCEQNTVTTSDLLDICTLVNSQDIGGHAVKQYTSTLLPNYLSDCKDLIEIATVDGILYITFETYAGETAYLTYTSNGLTNQIIYDAADDTAYILSKEETTKIVNFRQGTTELISEELLDTIDDCIQTNNYSAIKNNPYLSIAVDNDNNIVIEPKEAEGVMRATGVVGFTSETDLLNSLKSDFPFLNQKVPTGGSSYVYCQYLSQNVHFKVVDNRNSYVRAKADYKSFLASTALTLIAAYLEISTGGTITLLTQLGIGLAVIGGIQQITESVKLHRSANYKYNYERYGLVYDSTRFNDYVQVYSSFGQGTFSGGYNNKDQFDWIKNPQSTPEGKNISDIKSTCISRYNAELNVYGNCANYYPIGWFD